MSYTITPSPDSKYIVVKMKVDMTRKLAKEVTSQAFTLGRDLGISCYLIDLTESKNQESIVGSYKSAYEDLAHLPWQDSLTRAALLVDPEDHSHDFNETVLINAGLKVKLFRDRELAIPYLLGINPDSESPAV